MIMPSFATLFAGATGQFLCRDAPSLGAKFSNERQELFILVQCPWSLDDAGFNHLVPTTLTSRLFATGHFLYNGGPILDSLFFDELF